MTSLKTSIKTITYLSDIGCLEIQGASLARIVASIHKGVEYLFFFIHQSFYYSKWSNWSYPIIIILQYESVYLPTTRYRTART
ncbi:hypothetical protein EAI71_23545 [Escherichia coli]|nr:hypothetical protein EAI71_23545 [Escherichia coli]